MDRIILSGCIILNENNEILLLYRKDHNHYETPGGKLNPDECLNFENPTTEELAKAAKRELFEELGNKIRIKDIYYFGNVEFTIPDGRKAIANKFIVKIYGEPVINEPERFSKIEYIPIKSLEKYPISPDLKLLLHKIKNELGK